jgi:hypothetical protein
MLTFATVQIFHDLVGHLQSFQVNDPDVFVAMFPDLALLKFQGHLEFGEIVSPERAGETIELFLLAGGLFAGDGRFLFGGGVFGLGIFLAGLLLVCFGGFISHDV